MVLWARQNEEVVPIDLIHTHSHTTILCVSMEKLKCNSTTKYNYIYHFGLNYSSKDGVTSDPSLRVVRFTKDYYLNRCETYTKSVVCGCLYILIFRRDGFNLWNKLERTDNFTFSKNNVLSRLKPFFFVYLIIYPVKSFFFFLIQRRFGRNLSTNTYSQWFNALHCFV